MPVLIDWTSGERQACVTIHGCKIAYVHIQLAFEISVSLKISGGGDDPPTDHECVCVGGGSPPPPSLPPGRNPGCALQYRPITKIYVDGLRRLCIYDARSNIQRNRLQMCFNYSD